MVDSTTIVYDVNTAFYDLNNARFNPNSLTVQFGVPDNDIDLAEDIVVCGHELGHGWHYAFTLGGNDFWGDSGVIKGIAEYFGISYRRSQTLFQPNKRMNWAFSTIPLQPSIHSSDSLFFDQWDTYSAYPSYKEYLRYIYASALMDLEYRYATQPDSGINIGRDITHRILCQSMHYVTSASDHVANVLAMFQADIDLYEGAHLPQLIEVYTRRKLFDQILAEMPESKRIDGIAMVNEGFQIPANDTLTVDNLSYFVMNGNITVQPNATLVFNERTRVFNPENHAIHVYGTLKIAGNSRLPANIVVHNGGQLIINEGLAFAVPDGNTLTLLSGATVTAKGNGATLTVNGNLVMETGASIQYLGTEAPYGIVFKSLSEQTLENISIRNSRTIAIGDFVFQNCSFLRSNLSCTSKNITLSGCSFSRSTVRLGVRATETMARVMNCSFSQSTDRIALALSGYEEYQILENQFVGNYTGGLSISSCGIKKGDNHFIRGNTIENNLPSSGESEGVRLYNSVAIFMGNKIIGNNIGVGLYHNCLVEAFGDDGSPQIIANNTGVQVLAVDNSFPWRFSYNQFQHNNSEALISCIFNTANGGTEQKYNVEQNCWPTNFNPTTDLLPTNNFSWLPMWNCSGITTNPNPLEVEMLMNQGVALFKEEDYTPAKEIFETIVEQYPESMYAEASLKQLRKIYYQPSFSLTEFYQYLSENEQINNSTGLAQLAGYLKAETDAALNRTSQAWDFYNSVIANPETPADLVYATIDAEYLRLDDSNGNKAASINNFVNIELPRIAKHHNQRNLMLDGLKNAQAQSNATELEALRATGTADFRILPNPASQYIEVEFYSLETQKATLTITSMGEKVISNYSMDCIKDQKISNRISIADLEPGIYMVALKCNNGVRQVRKLVVFR
ncbi:MAG: T9SS type A sorting domain-containing protein [Salinivirgaceae bacterium]|nr:T9SS type A sorting domain-containing protein [Salinivirgaceae bacterium]